ncbi:MAG TPA: TetR/AcrR family transcriptional regulator [Dehalococcoidia bacterium]
MVGTHPRKRLGAAARRESILAAAMPEFATSGYDRTRVSDIAAKVGVTEPVVFQNFGTKPNLFVAVLDRMSDEVAQLLLELGDHSRDVAQLLSVLLSHELQDRLHSSGGLGMTFAEAGANPEPSIRAAGRRAHERTLQAIAGLLRRGQGEGSIRDDVEAVSLGWLVISQIHARQFRRAHSDTSPTLEYAMLEALLAALQPPSRA